MVQKAMGYFIAEIIHDRSGKPANLLEFAKRLLAAFPGPAGPLFAENDPLDHFPGAQAPKPRLPARALWLKSDKLIPLAPPWSQRRSQTGSIMRPSWLHHEATTALSGSMVEPNPIYIIYTLLFYI